MPSGQGFNCKEGIFPGKEHYLPRGSFFRIPGSEGLPTFSKAIPLGIFLLSCPLVGVSSYRRRFFSGNNNIPPGDIFTYRLEAGISNIFEGVPFNCMQGVFSRHGTKSPGILFASPGIRVSGRASDSAHMSVESLDYCRGFCKRYHPTVQGTIKKKTIFR